MTKLAIDKIKDILETERKILLTKISNIDSVDSDGDEMDKIQANLIIGVEKKLSERDAAKITLINFALNKIKNNTYGICEDCEDEIPEKRLMHNPCFKLCVNCSEEREIDAKRNRC